MHNTKRWRLGALLLVLAAAVSGWIWQPPLLGLYMGPAPRAPRAPQPTAVLSHELTGQIVSADGTPLAGATILLGAKDLYIHVDERHPLRRTEATAASDAEGRFSLRAPIGPVTLYAMHETGFAVGIFPTESFVGVHLTLQPWAEVEVTVMHGDKTVAGIDVRADLHDVAPGSDYLRCIGRGTSNAAGVAIIRRVPAGYGDVGVSKWGGDNSGLRFEGAVVTRAGERVRATLGGQGRRFTGLVTNARGFTPSPLEDVHGALRQVRNLTPPPEDLDEKAQWAWREAWSATPEGMLQNNVFAMYTFELRKDGSFTVDDVRPGRYALEIHHYGEPEPDTGYLYPIAAYEAFVEITPPSDENDQKDFALGVVRLEKVQKDAGQTAPAFDFLSLDGEKHRLSDFKGQYVLLDFWGVFCGPCRKAIPELRALHEKYAPTGKFTLIGLSADQELRTLTKFLGEEQLPWMQVHLGSQSSQTIDEIYGVRGYPTGVLIDPRGKIIASGLRGDALIKAVDDAMQAD